MSRKRRNNPPDDPSQLPPSLFDDYLFDDAQSAEEKSAASEDSASGDAESSAEEKSAAQFPTGNGPLRDLMDENFRQFASYTICSRAIPTVEDGLKPVQRRILHALHEKDDGRFVKVANIVGHTMQYHPHGDASIGDALVNLANKRYLIEGQGNFGNVFTGAPAAAPRYIECRLTELAREQIFNKKTTAYTPSYDGRNQEPILLPAKIPLLLMLGADGIAVGLATSVLPHNFIELLEAEIAIIQNKPFQLFPDFRLGGLMDTSEYNDGLGKVKVRAVIEPRDKNKLVIREIPWGQTTDGLIAKIEAAEKKHKIGIRQIHDFTAANVEIELTLGVGAIPEKVTAALYALTDCESSLQSRPTVLYKGRPTEMSVSEILRANVQQLLELTQRELEIRAAELAQLFHDKTLDQIFVEERIYKRIEDEATWDGVKKTVMDGLLPFRARLRRDITDDDIERLLQIRIRRISAFDINRNRAELDAILKEEAEVAANIKGLRGYVVKYIKSLIKKYHDAFPRLTQIVAEPFQAIEVRHLTSTELTIRIDRENGYIGTAVRGGEELFKCSSHDKLLVIWEDGRYKLIAPPDKFFIDKNFIECRIHNRETLFTAAYTEAKFGFSYLKRFAFGGAILGRDYRLAPEGSKIIFFAEGTPENLYVKYRPAKGQRIHRQLFVPTEIAVKGIGARGNQMTSKPIAKISTQKPRGWEDDEDSAALKGQLF